jgi:hypothetical protein
MRNQKEIKVGTILRNLSLRRNQSASNNQALYRSQTQFIPCGREKTGKDE